MLYSIRAPKEIRKSCTQILKRHKAEIQKRATGCKSVTITETTQRVQVCIMGGEYSVNTLGDYLAKLLPKDAQVPYWG